MADVSSHVSMQPVKNGNNSCVIWFKVVFALLGMSIFEFKGREKKVDSVNKRKKTNK
jgi:hypothetical protein